MTSRAVGRMAPRTGQPALRARLAAAERRAREVEERYALATSAALEGIYEWDVDAGKLLLTERAKAFFALAADDLTPAAWNARIHPDDYADYRAAIVDHFKGLAPHLEHEYRILDAGRGYRWILDRGVGVRDASGRITKLVGALSDITQRKMAEIALMRARDEAEEALEQQSAVSDILRVMCRSPTDAQPVFDLLAQRAGKLCKAGVAVVSRFDGKRIDLAAVDGVNPEAVGMVRRLYPLPVDSESMTARVVRSAHVVHVEDVLSDRSYAMKDFARAAGYRAGLCVPILRSHCVIGAIFVGRKTPGAFTDSQVELLKAFADQAAIAIENVRLFHETKERLEQQTATSDILRVISGSHSDLDPVFDKIAQTTLKLCRASSALVFTFDGVLIRLAAVANVDAEAADAWHRAFPRPPGRDTAATRAILGCEIVVIPDVLDDPDYVIGSMAARTGFRSALAVPLVRDAKSIGAIGIGRPEPGGFPDTQIALLQTFADQAVIAIENARLFTELQARTEQLTRSVGELKALGEVGEAVSSTLDLDTVLTTVVSRATELAGMDGGSVWEYDATREEFYVHATDRLPAEVVDVLRSTPIGKGQGALGRLATTGEPVEIGDIAAEGRYPRDVRDALVGCGYRSVLTVPLVREDRLLGALAVHRKMAGAFPRETVDLLARFATQSALAIQNAQLFREIEDKSRQIEVASRHKSEFLANMSHELRTPLNAIIGFSEVLHERMFGEINDRQAEYLRDILESGRHLLSLINDILDLSKIEAGRMELSPDEFHLPTAVENTLTLVRERAQRRSIALASTVDAQVATIHADERKVKQVLLNLLSNALKFTPEGGRVDVRTRVIDGHARISVTDTGVGIPQDEQAAVFDEFRQVGSAARKAEGTGLGLAISRKFVELHGGRIWVESRPGVGSTFAFSLPLAAADAGPTSEGPTSRTAQ